MNARFRTFGHSLLVLIVAMCASGQTVPYLKLTAPQQIMPEAQAWEGNQFPPH